MSQIPTSSRGFRVINRLYLWTKEGSSFLRRLMSEGKQNMTSTWRNTKYICTHRGTKIRYPILPTSHSRLMSLKKSAVININTTFSQSIPSQSSSPQNNLPQISISQSSLPQNNLPQISPSQSSLPQDDPLSPTAPNQRVRAISEATGLRLARTKPSGFIFWSTLSEIIYALLVD